MINNNFDWLNKPPMLINRLHFVIHSFFFELYRVTKETIGAAYATLLPKSFWWRFIEPNPNSCRRIEIGRICCEFRLKRFTICVRARHNNGAISFMFHFVLVLPAISKHDMYFFSALRLRLPSAVISKHMPSKREMILISKQRDALLPTNGVEAPASNRLHRHSHREPRLNGRNESESERQRTETPGQHTKSCATE